MPSDLAGASDNQRNRVAIVAAVCVLVLLASVLCYARSAWLLAFSTLVTEGIYALLWIVAALGIGGAVLTTIKLRFCSPTLQATTSAALGLGIISLLVLVLGLAGVMNRASALAIVCVGLLAAGVLVLRIAGKVPRLGRVPPTAWMWPLAAAAAGLVAFAALVPPGILFGDEPNGYDVLEYHLQVPREWYDAGRITPLNHNVYSFLPFNVEMHYLLAMHLRGGAWNGMYLAQLMSATMTALAVAAVYGVLAEIGGAATIGAVIFATTPWTMLIAPIAYDESGLLMFGALALGLPLIAMRESQPRKRMMSLAGAFAGFACGTKLTAAPMILLAVPLSLFSLFLWERGGVKGLAKISGAGAVFVLAGIVTISPWLIRNYVWGAIRCSPKQPHSSVARTLPTCKLIDGSGRTSHDPIRQAPWLDWPPPGARS